MKRKISAVLLAALVLGLVTSAASADSSSTNDLSANVTSTVAVDVKPEDLAYPSLSVGELQKTSNRSFPGVEIVNTGSEYIDQVWLETSYPHTRPFGDGSASAHDAGNFMVVKPEDSSSSDILGDKNAYHYVNRKEFVDSNPPNFINTPPTDGSVSINSVSVNNTHVGQIRFGDQWFYYMLPTSGENLCTGGSGVNTLRVGTVPHTSDQMGTVDFTSDGLDTTTSGQDPDKKWQDYTISASSDSSSYGVAKAVQFNFKSGVGTFNGTQEYDILTACSGDTAFDTNHVVLNKYNVAFNTTTDLASNGQSTTYLLNEQSNSDQMLKPSQSFSLKTGMRVPRGTTAGQVDPGTLTVFANADKSQT